MKVSIGLYFIEQNSVKNGAILNSLNEAGLTVDGNQIELVCETDNKENLCRVWTEGTLEQFRAAADLIFAINHGATVIFTANDLSEQQFDRLEAVALSYKIDFDDGAAADNEFFGYCEDVNHIKLLVDQLT